MKWFRFLFAIYLLCLAFFPCTDNEFNEITQTSHSFSVTHQVPDAVDDSCSPLCLCNCCGISITLLKIKSKEEIHPPIVFTSLIVLWNEEYLDLDYLDEIWQPPRLV